MKTIWIWSFTLFSIEVSVLGIPCSDRQSETCVGVLDPFFFTNLTFPLTRMVSASDWENMCGYGKETFLDCSTNDFTDCNEEQTLRFSTLQYVAKFMCSEEGKEGWDGPVQCLSSGNPSLITETCLSTFSNLREVIIELRNRERYECSLLKSFMSCAGTAVEESCGREAALWQTQYLINMLQSRADKTRCTIDGVPMGIVIAIITGVISLGSAIAAVAIYFYNRRLLALRQKKYGNPDESTNPTDIKYEVRQGF